MNFLEIAQARQSCRSYDVSRPVEQEKLDTVLEAALIRKVEASPTVLGTIPEEAAKRVRPGLQQ